MRSNCMADSQDIDVMPRRRCRCCCKGNVRWCETTMVIVKRRICRRLFKLSIVSGLTFIIVIAVKSLVAPNNDVGLPARRLTDELQRAARPRPPSDENEIASMQYEHLIDAIHARADSDRYIILAMTDEAFIDMTINFYEASLRAHHVDNFLFVGLGRRTCEMLSNMSIACFYYADDPSAGKASSFGQLDFIRKMNFRTDMILDALAANFSVIHTDTDVAFLGNPLTEIKLELRNYDIAPLWDTSLYNAGFIVIKASPSAQRVYNRVRDMTKRSRRLDDQGALNQVLRTFKKEDTSFPVRKLDRKIFQSGCDYFEKAGRFYPKAKDCNRLSNNSSCPLVVHNNWIVGKAAKIYRFREHLMWLYDGPEQYYSSVSRKYLSYTNIRPTADNNSTKNVTEREISALKTAMTIGHLLNRVVILPRFHCGTRECPLNSLLHIKTFDAQFSGLYRESSFLGHPKVPESVKQGVEHRQLQRNYKSSSDMVKMSARDILQRYGKSKAAVLNVGSLFGCVISINGTSTNATEFSSVLQKGFRRSAYRQYQ